MYLQMYETNTGGSRLGVCVCVGGGGGVGRVLKTVNIQRY